MPNTKTYTQDGVTAELWSYRSLLIGTRWQMLLTGMGDTIPQRDTSLYDLFSGFAAFVVHATNLRFEGNEAEWTTALKAWWDTHSAALKAGQFADAWNDFCAFEHDAILDFIYAAYDQTRRDYVPASPELQTETGDGDFLADGGKKSSRSRRKS
jgi:hypothetical protein